MSTLREVAVPLPDGTPLPALLVEADGPGPRPAVLVGGDIVGARGPFIDMIAATLADAGFDALVPEFFFREGPLDRVTPESVFARRARLDDLRALRDLQAALDWLRARPAFAGPRVGVVGFCMGGTFALNLAAARDDLATVAFYGFPGETPAAAGVQGPYPRDEVDAAHGPIRAFWGDADDRAGPDRIAAYVAAMAARDVDFEAVVYPGLGHGFLSAGWEAGAAGHDQAVEAWEATLAFLHKHV
jgi:carboxymethylenebutenolidase